MFGTEWRRCRLVLRAFEYVFEPLLSHHDVSQTKFSSTLSPMNKEKINISRRSQITLFMAKKGVLSQERLIGSPIYYVQSREVKLQAAADYRIRVQLQRIFGCLWLISAHVFVLKLTGNTGLQRAYKTQDKCIFKAGPTFKLILLFLSPRTCKQGGKNARAGKNPNIFQNWSILSCFTVQLTLTDKQQYVVFYFNASSIDRLLIPSKVSQLH